MNCVHSLHNNLWVVAHMKKMAKKARKKRGASFTTEEMAVRLDEVEQNQNILFCSFWGIVSYMVCAALLIGLN